MIHNAVDETCPIICLGLSSETVQLLRDQDIFRINDLLDCEEEGPLTDIPGITRQQLREIVDALSSAQFEPRGRDDI